MTAEVTDKVTVKKHVHRKFKPKMRPVKVVPISVKPRRRGSARRSDACSGLVVNLRKRLQLTQAIFAQLLPVSVRSLATLESGLPPTDVVARRLIELQRLTKALVEVMKKESLGRWLQTPNEAFDRLKPLEVINRGESDRIWSMIYFLRSGVPS